MSRWDIRLGPTFWRLAGLALLFIVALKLCHRVTEDEWRARREASHAEARMAFQVRSEAVRRGIGLNEVFGDSCTDDCSGHRAGYLWALDQPVGADFDCQSSRSRSFREGCEMGAEAREYEDGA